MNYTTMGEVCGSCGHTHRSLRTAWQCAEDHHRGCKSQGGYSDRKVVRFNGDRLTESEVEELYQIEDEIHG